MWVMRLRVLVLLLLFSYSGLANDSFVNVWKKKNVAYKVKRGESIHSILKRLGHIKRSDDQAVSHAKVMQIIWRNGLYSKNVKEGDILWITPRNKKKIGREVAKVTAVGLGPLLIPTKPGRTFLEYWSNNNIAYYTNEGDTLETVLLDNTYIVQTDDERLKTFYVADLVRRNGKYSEKLDQDEIIWLPGSHNRVGRKIASVVEISTEVSTKKDTPAKKNKYKFSYLLGSVKIDSTVDITGSLEFKLHKFNLGYQYNFKNNYYLKASAGAVMTQSMIVSTTSQTKDFIASAFGFDMDMSAGKTFGMFNVSADYRYLRYFINTGSNSGNLVYVDTNISKLQLNTSYTFIYKKYFITPFASTGVFMPKTATDYEVKSGSDFSIGSAFSFKQHSIIFLMNKSSLTTNFGSDSSTATILGYSYSM
jgi:hypothetical protein